MKALSRKRALSSMGRIGAKAGMVLFWLVLAAAVFLEALRQYLRARLDAAALLPRPAGAAPGPVARAALAVGRFGPRPHWIRESPEERPA